MDHFQRTSARIIPNELAENLINELALFRTLHMAYIPTKSSLGTELGTDLIQVQESRSGGRIHDSFLVLRRNTTGSKEINVANVQKALARRSKKRRASSSGGLQTGGGRQATNEPINVEEQVGSEDEASDTSFDFFSEPFLLVNIGSGVSILHVTADDHSRVGGTGCGGRRCCMSRRMITAASAALVVEVGGAACHGG